MKDSTTYVDKWNGIEDPDFHALENNVNPAPRPFTILSGAQLHAQVIDVEVGQSQRLDAGNEES